MTMLLIALGFCVICTLRVHIYCCPYTVIYCCASAYASAIVDSTSKCNSQWPAGHWLLHFSPGAGRGGDIN